MSKQHNVVEIQPTNVAGITVEWDENGNHCILDNVRGMRSEWASYRGIATLDMPEAAEIGRRFWMHVTQYYAGTLPAEVLLEVRQP